jgi:hypothetical protein
MTRRMSEGQRNAQRRRAGRIGREQGKPPDNQHSSNCNAWVGEPCNCVMRFDAKDLYDRYRQLEERKS